MPQSLLKLTNLFISCPRDIIQCCQSGLEDNLWLDKGVPASNGSLTERAVEIITRLGGKPMTPAEGRVAMGLKKRG